MGTPGGSRWRRSGRSPLAPGADRQAGAPEVHERVAPRAPPGRSTCWASASAAAAPPQRLRVALATEPPAVTSSPMARARSAWAMARSSGSPSSPSTASARSIAPWEESGPTAQYGLAGKRDEGARGSLAPSSRRAAAMASVATASRDRSGSEGSPNRPGPCPGWRGRRSGAGRRGAGRPRRAAPLADARRRRRPGGRLEASSEQQLDVMAAGGVVDDAGRLGAALVEIPRQLPMHPDLLRGGQRVLDRRARHQAPPRNEGEASPSRCRCALRPPGSRRSRRRAPR